jgi:CPA2 family monovalent cation:H+ antiporter-2
VQPEFEASLELSTHLLTSMGASLSSIQLEVQQIRNSHYYELRPERSANQISRDLRVAAQDMNSKWYSLPEFSPLLGMTLEETDLRRLTGVSLMAIRRAGGNEVDYPDAQTTIEQGDRLLIVGQPEELAAFDELAKGETAVPKEGSSCQWLMVPEGSPIAGQTLAELDLQRQYDVQVQAIRREGRFIRFPDDDTDILVGDRLLLCGNREPLLQLGQWIAPPLQLPLLQIPVVKVNASETLQEFLPPDSLREL